MSREGVAVKKGLRVLVLAALVAGCATVTAVAVSRERWPSRLRRADRVAGVRALARPDPVLARAGRRLRGRARLEALGGATVVSGNDPYFLRPGSSSLYLPAGASATSPLTCVGTLALTMRMMASNSGSLLSPLKVEILYTTSSGARRTALVGQRTGGAAWSPGLLPDVYLLASLRPLLSQLGQNGGLITQVQSASPRSPACSGRVAGGSAACSSIPGSAAGR